MGLLLHYSCLKNAVSLFHVLEKELEWRESVGRAGGYAAMKACKPILAVGPEHPLEEESLMADYFRMHIVPLYTRKKNTF